MNHIKEVLKEQGRTQKWLTILICKSYDMVSAYVENTQQPKLEILFEKGKTLGVDLKELIKSDNE